MPNKMLSTASFVTFLTFLTLSVAVSGVYIPTMVIRGPSIAIEYDKIHLKCFFTLAGHKHFQWYFSPNAFDAQFEPLAAHPSGVVRLNSNRTILTIRSVDKSHVGSYRCCAMDTVCARMHLSVLSVLDDHLKLGSATHLTHTAIDSGMLDVPNRGNFSIAIYHPPFIRGEVYIEHGPSTVSFCDHFRMRSKSCVEQQTPATLSYAVQNVTQEDGGQFDVRIHFNRRVERFHLYILVRGTPIVQMDNYSVLNSADHISLVCRGVGYPAPNVTFTYTPRSPTEMGHLPSGGHSDKGITLPQSSTRLALAYHTTNFEALVPWWPVANGPGIVSCRASNTEGTTAISTFLYVRNFLEPMLFRVVAPTDAVLYGDSVNITCQADVYNFTNQFTIRHGGHSYELTGRRHHYAWTVTYLVHITNGSHNEVSCEAMHRNGTVLESTLNLSIQYPSKPHIVSVADTVNVTIPVEVQVRLECDIDGTPTPTIVWFKNDNYLRHEQGHFIRIVLEPDEAWATYKCLGTSRLGSTAKTWHIVREDSMQWLLMAGTGAGGLLTLLLAGTVVWAVQAYRQLLQRQTELEEQLCGTDDKVSLGYRVIDV